MAYSKWTTNEELKSRLTQISYDSEIKKSGIPMMYDEDHLYIKDDDNHTMIIGSIGSGKTQTTMLPQLRLAIKAQESFIVRDVKGEIHNILSEELKKQNYNTIIINLDDPSFGNNFNPLDLPYELYQNGQKDMALELLEHIAYYFCCNETIDTNIDPFWNNIAESLFIGLALYLFENEKKEKITISGILNLVSEFDKISEEVESYDTNSPTYINLCSVILAPNDTKSSILSVFINNMRSYVSRETLLKMLSSSNFDIKNIQKDKTALFIIGNSTSTSKRLIPLIIDECFFATEIINDRSRRLNILIDDFENLVPFNDFKIMLTLSRRYNIKFNIYMKSLLELKNTYGDKETEILKIIFGNIIYLLTNDRETLEDVSRLCGSQETEKGIAPLITTEDLKLLNNFEAIILIPRMNPIKTKLLPDYQIDWKRNS